MEGSNLTPKPHFLVFSTKQRSILVVDYGRIFLMLTMTMISEAASSSLIFAAHSPKQPRQPVILRALCVWTQPSPKVKDTQAASLCPDTTFTKSKRHTVSRFFKVCPGRGTFSHARHALCVCLEQFSKLTCY